MQAANGHPYAKISWPHSVLLDSKKAIEGLRADLEQVHRKMKDLEADKQFLRGLLRALTTLPMDALFAMHEAVQEYHRACAKHPKFPSDPFQQLAIVTEELGEAAQACNDMTWAGGDPNRLRSELIQTTAMGLRCLVNLPSESRRLEREASPVDADSVAP